MTPRDLAAALATVPGWRLALLDLARELVGPEGIDDSLAAERAAEIEQAIREAHAYASAVKALHSSIHALAAIASAQETPG